MRIEIKKEEDLRIIKLIGRYDIEEVHDFLTLFINQINLNIPTIALNLSDLNYIDSSGISSLIRCMNIAVKNKVDFLCYNVHKNVQNIFELAKIDQYLKILSKEEFLNKYLTVSDAS